MLPKKYLIVIFGLVFVGTVLALALFGGPADPTNPDTPPTDGNESNLVGVEASELPTGVTVDSVIPSALLDEHRTALDNAHSYTMTVTTRTTIDGETQVQRTRYQKGQEGIRATTTVDGDLLTERYAEVENGTLYERRVENGEPTYTVKEGRTLSPSNDRTLGPMFNGGLWEPKSLDSTTTPPTVTLHANGIEAADTLVQQFSLTEIASFTGNATVTDDQLIRTVAVTAEGVRDEVNVTVTYETKLEAVNNTAVSQPDWATEADNDTTSSWAGVSGDRRSIYTSHRGGQPLDAGTTLDVYADTGETFTKHSTVLPTEFTAGDTLYLTLVDGELTLYENTPPDQRGDVLTADEYYIEFIPPGMDTPALEFEVIPPER